MNSAVAATGMVMFFILSGFLIANILLNDRNITNFLIRRFMRIIPLAWLAMLITLILSSSKKEIYLPHFLFYANWEPIALTTGTGHLWSLCVEMQFYVLIAALVAILKSRAFLLLPVLCFAVTAYRYFSGVEIAINTYYRVDEILAGCILALFYNYSEPAKRFIGFLNPIYMFPLLLLSAHPEGGAFNYFRPYIAMLIIGSTLFKKESVWWNKWLNNRILLYIASVSYALYVIHGGLGHTWLGEGGTFEKYAKRPLLFAVTFLLAHISTFYFEKYWINLGKRLTSNYNS
jgi:peptidoglycan/LPS O-acetylase OafA/YrhL